MKKTKIICTIGPASEKKEVMKKLIETGMNVVRMNFSHGGYEEQGARIKTTRLLNQELNTHVALLLDTKGPEIRTHLFENGTTVIEKGSTVRISMKEVLGTKEKFSITYAGLYDDISIGGSVLVDDGYLSLLVKEKDEKNKELVCEAKNTHKVKDRRGINVPNVKLNMDFISPKDKADIEFACDQDLDFIAASFVRRASDVLEIREILKNKKNSNIKIISKIENQEGVDNLDEIIAVSDGIMVARGDLGVEIPAEEVPSLQKEMIRKCNQFGKMVIVATQMLESMQQNPRPTRAEVSDVANAVLDGTDATMLSGESAGGDYPPEAVEYMDRINKRIELDIDHYSLLENALEGIYEKDTVLALGLGANQMALEFGALAIITEDNVEIARAVSRFRPVCPIISCVNNGQDARSLALSFAVRAIVGKKDDAVKFIKENFDFTEEDFVIYVTNKSIEIIKFA